MTELVDTLIRYKEKGSYSGMKSNNPETVVEELLRNIGVSFEKGDLRELIKNAPDSKRTMDFIIPNKQTPLIVVESSFLATTSSGQGDKSKTEIAIDTLLKEHYPNAHFVGFVDGIGWYVRKNDLRRMVNAYEDVFTFHKDELFRFEQLVRSTLGK
ncbi:DpnII family type II restriction endonuclease [Treponema endosymbiont of Eucomonympha sp.]|uniref:DpnII family type II restriction endonuclease n=1 Tax=Treponema endosymbiont of Eucomonympha sp. TaxID=1580831 RepID=UPI001EE76DF6|nr:DpnII family type II restriction endonuclease [Treponema endosymbiont of Eucomonympha sp.]